MNAIRTSSHIIAWGSLLASFSLAMMLSSCTAAPTDSTASTGAKSFVPLATPSPSTVVAAPTSPSTTVGDAATASVSPLVSISLAPATQTLALGASAKLTLTGLRKDGSTATTFNDATWSLSNTGVAFLDGSHNPPFIQALTAGTTTLSAQVGDLTAQAVLVVVDNGQIQSLSISPQRNSMVLGDKVVLSAIGFYGNGTQADVTTLATFSISKSSAAVLDLTTPSKPTLNATGSGKVTVTVAYAGLTFNLPITVMSPQLQSIAIAPLATSPLVGSTASFVATGSFADGSTHDLTAAVTWTSSAPAVLAFGAVGAPNGQASIIKIGTSQVGAAFAGQTATLSVTSLALTGIKSLKILAPTLIAPLGRTLNFTAQATMIDNSVSDVTSGVTWASADPTIVTVAVNASGSAAVITPVQQSTSPVAITATLPNVTPATVRVSVTSSSALIGLTIVPADSTAATPLHSACGSNTAQFKALGHYANQPDGAVGSDVTTDSNLTWSSQDVTIAKNAVGLPGQYVTLTPGTVTIQATYIDPVAGDAVTGTADLAVTSPALTGIVLVSNPVSAPIGKTFLYSLQGTYACGTPQALTDPFTVASTGTVPASIGLTFSTTNASVQTRSTSTLLTAPTTMTIQATYVNNGTTYNSSVVNTVKPADLVSLAVTSTQFVSYNGPYHYVNEAGNLPLTLTGTMSDGSSLTLAGLTSAPYSYTTTWTTDSAAIATLNSSGTLHGVSVGRTGGHVSIVNTANTTVTSDFTISTQRVCATGTQFQNLYCLFLAPLNTACDTTCTGAGLVTDTVGLSYIQGLGDTGASQCYAAGQALISGGPDSSNAYLNLTTSAGAGLGCAFNNSTVLRFTYNAATGAAKNTTVQRACACR